MKQKIYSKIEKEAFLETGNFIYANPATRWATNQGHKACSHLRKFDSHRSTVVDLGCGEGDHFPYIKNANIIGIDSLPEMLANAEKKYPGRAQLRQESIFNLSFEDNSQKSMFSFSVLEHLTPLEDALKEIHRVLADDGEFIFGIPSEGFLYRIGRLSVQRHVEKATGVDYDSLLSKEHVNRCSDILAALKKYFCIEKLVGVPFIIPRINFNIFLVGRCIKEQDNE
jgi:phosphatidylethanolamine/phosphatidyl-N-methylethanolamine N-methyltransferase